MGPRRWGALALLVALGCGDNLRANRSWTDGGSAEMTGRTDASPVDLRLADTGSPPDITGSVDGPTSPSVDGNAGDAEGPIGRAVGCASPGTVWAGKEILLDAFPTKDGVIVVRADRLSIVSRTGQEIKVVVPPRPITSAAFDGALLAVADPAIVTAYSPTLEPQGMTNLVEPCGASVMVSAQRFVCGSQRDTDRVFNTYDLVQQARIGMSMMYTYHGLPMRRLPLLDHFVTASIGSGPHDYHLHRVDSLGITRHLGRSMLHSYYYPDLAFGFVGRPATHMVVPDGSMLKIFSANCDPMSAGHFNNVCFATVGSIGTLWPNERFAALASDQKQDILYAVVAFGEKYTLPPVISCKGACKVQRIDPTARLVVGQRSYPLPLKQVLTASYDQDCQMLLLGYLAEGSDAGYRVDLLEHGGP